MLFSEFWDRCHGCARGFQSEKRADSEASRGDTSASTQETSGLVDLCRLCPAQGQHQHKGKDLAIFSVRGRVARNRRSIPGPPMLLMIACRASWTAVKGGP